MTNKKSKPQNQFREPAKICLSVIVKNESKVIERMLTSVFSILDYYCVVDTGSTDGTQDIIKKFFDEKGIPGKIIQHDWKNFEDARNRALKETIILFQEEGVKNGYGYWQDADEEMQIAPNFNMSIFKKNLSAFDGGNVMIYYGGQNYYRTQFFRADANWRWYGPVHEVLISDDKLLVSPIDGISVLVRPDGNSWIAETIQEKYEGHAKILEDYVKNDPKKDPRWIFYLAQSYRDAGTEDSRRKSLEWYEKRVSTTGGYWEEIYFSALMVANLKSALGYPKEDVIDSFLRCGKYNKYRIEHLIPIILHYQSIKEFDIAYIIGLRAIQSDGKLPLPQSSLFIDNAIYHWRIFDVHSLSCWYSGRQDEGKIAFKKLIKAMDRGLVPEQHHQRIRDNKKHFLGL